MVFQVVFIFSHKRTFRAKTKKIVMFDVSMFRFFKNHSPIEHFFWFDMHLGVSPKVFLGNSYKITLLTFECLDFSLRVDFRNSDACNKRFEKWLHDEYRKSNMYQYIPWSSSKSSGVKLCSSFKWSLYSGSDLVQNSHLAHLARNKKVRQARLGVTLHYLVYLNS